MLSFKIKSIYKRKMKSESGFSLTMASQPFHKKNTEKSTTLSTNTSEKYWWEYAIEKDW